MKRILAALLVLCAVGWAASSFADIGEGVLHTDNLKWRTSAAAYSNGGIRDSTSFKADGSAAANRDTSAWLDISDMSPWSAGLASAGDSTLFIRFTIAPTTGTTLGIGADSLYAYVEGTSDPDIGPTVRLATNLTEILSTEVNSNNAFEFKITAARAAIQLMGLPFIRIIVRGDLNGEFSGIAAYYTNSNAKMR